MHHLIPHFIDQQFRAGARGGRFDGAALFIDVEGFTRLTETLSKQGSEGAGAVTRALNDLLGPPVQTVYDWGGFISNFAGDGFTALFPGDEGAEAAVCAAWDMRDFILHHGEVSTHYGAFRLGARIGLGWGAVEWGIVGQGERHAYFFRGPAVATCVAAEKQAAAGMVALAPALLQRLESQVTTEPLPGGAHELIMHSLALAAETAEAPALSAEALVAFGLRVVMDGDWPAEFREIASVFINLDESAAPAGRAALETFVAATLDAAAQHGGYFNKLEFGDKGGVMLLLFGAPQAQERNLDRAVDFLLDLRGRDLPLAWRAGLTVGRAYSGFLGGDVRREYTPIGETVNLAARLMAAATMGDVWANPAAAARLIAYDFEAAGALKLKNIAQPVEAQRLRGPRALPQYHGALLGRGAQMQALLDALSPIFDGQPAGLIMLQGEAGHGKTRLANEVKNTLAQQGAGWFLCPADELQREDLRPFKVFAAQYFAQEPRAPFAENRRRFIERAAALREALTERQRFDLARDLEQSQPFLARLANLPLQSFEGWDEKLLFENTIDAFTTLARAASQAQPLVIQVEDGHWLDDSSRQVLAALLKLTDPVAVLVTTRPQAEPALDLGPEVAVTPIDLRPLPLADITRLAEERIGGALNPDTARLIYTNTRGNPLFAEQLVSALIEGKKLKEAEGWRIDTNEMHAIPSGSDIPAAKLDLLKLETRRVVQDASVLGQNFETTLLRAVLDDVNDLDAHIAGAEAQQIWAREENRVSFNHALLRTAAHDRLDSDRRQSLHAKAARAIERLYRDDLTPHYRMLAYHYKEARQEQHERRYARLSGEQAAASYANQDAEEFLTRALQLAPNGEFEERFQLRAQRERVYSRLSWREQQVADLDQLEILAERLDKNERRAGVALRWGYYEQSQGAFDGALRSLDEAARWAADDAPEIALDARVLKGLVQIDRGDFEQAEAHFQAVYDELADPEQPPAVLIDPKRRLRFMAAALRGLSTALEHLERDLDRALEMLQEAARIDEQSGDRVALGQTLNNLGNNYFYRGKMDTAHDYFQRAHAIFTEIGERRAAARVTIGVGMTAFLLGRHDEAIKSMRAGIERARAIGDRHSEATLRQNLANALQLRGEFDETEAQYLQAMAIHSEIGSRLGAAQVAANLGLLFRNLGQYHRALPEYDRARALYEAIPYEHGVANVDFGLGIVATDLGDFETAHACLGRALGFFTVRSEGSETPNDPEGEADLRAVEALLYSQHGLYDVAYEAGQQALAAARRIDAQSMEGYALTHLGHALAGMERLDEAADYYRQALTLREALGERHLAAETRAGLVGVLRLMNDIPAMMRETEALLDYLWPGGMVNGTNEPARIYLEAWRALATVGDARAPEMLHRGHTLLQRRAGTVDRRLRRSYLENIPAHRALLAAWAEQGG